MAKIKRYISGDGCYLAIDERNGVNYIAWFIPAEDDFGSYIGEGDAPEESEADNLEAWENWVVYETAKLHADGKDDRAFFFETIRKARVALAACNEALTTRSRPWPVWALQAKAAGWKP